MELLITAFLNLTNEVNMNLWFEEIDEKNYRWSEEVDAILKIGIWLKEDAGIHNWVLTKSQALFALNVFRQKRIGMLGLDVYEKSDNGLKTNYDNFFCDPKPNESYESFAHRSIMLTKKYINEYKEDSNTNIFYAFVPAISKDLENLLHVQSLT